MSESLKTQAAFWRKEHIRFPLSPPSDTYAELAFSELRKLDATSLWKRGAWSSRSEVQGKLDFYIERSSIGAHASDRFHWAARMACDTLNSPSAIRSWFDPKIRKSVESSAYFEEDPRAALLLRKYIPSQFRPSVAKAIYQTFPCSRVYDPCGGWGDRMSAAMACEDVQRYHCRDVNPAVFTGYSEQIARFDSCDKVSAEMLQAESGGLDGMDFDLVFTSPPYYKIEKYGGALQSHAIYKGFDAWLNGFLFPMAKCSWAAIRASGHMVLNVADCYADHRINRMCNPLVDWAVSNLESCQYLGAVGISIPKRSGKGIVKIEGVSAEPILIFSKGDSDVLEKISNYCGDSELELGL